MAAALWNRQRQVAEQEQPPACGEVGNVNLLKIQLNSKREALEEVGRVKLAGLQTTSADLREKFLKLSEEAPSCKVEIDALLEDLKAKHAKAETHLAVGFKGMLETIKQDTSEAKDCWALKPVKEGLEAAKKQLSQDGVYEYTVFCRSLTRTIVAMNRKNQLVVSASASASRRPAVIANPMFTALRSLSEDGDINVGESIFEAKGGMRPALVKITSVQAFENVVKAALMKRSISRADKALKQGLACVVDHLIAGRQVQKKFEQLVNQSVPMELRSKRSLPSMPWAAKVFQFQLYASGPCAVEVTWPPYGMMMAGIVLKGAVCFTGLSNARVPGNSFREKRDRVMRMSRAEIQAIVADGGFHVRYENGVSAHGVCCFVIPSGFMLLTAAQDVQFLR